MKLTKKYTTLTLLVADLKSFEYEDLGYTKRLKITTYGSLDYMSEINQNSTIINYDWNKKGELYYKEFDSGLFSYGINGIDQWWSSRPSVVNKYLNTNLEECIVNGVPYAIDKDASEFIRIGMVLKEERGKNATIDGFHKLGVSTNHSDGTQRSVMDMLNELSEKINKILK